MTFAFRNLEIDPVRWELRRDGRAIVVQPLVFDLLLYLVRHPNVLVTKEALVRDVWKGVVVGDGAIAQAISVARRALGADDDAAPAIHTVWGRGYRLVGHVRELGADDGAAPVTRETAVRTADGSLVKRAEVMAVLERVFADGRRGGRRPSRRPLRRGRSPAWPDPERTRR